MLKRVAFVLVVCLCVGVAYGAATKIRWFDNIAESNPDADGMAILNYVAGQDNIIAQVILSDLVADTQYVVALREPGTWTLDGNVGVFEPHPLGGFFFPISAGAQGQLSTDGKGHLTFHSQTTVGSGDFSDSDVFVILYSDWTARVVDVDGNLRISVRMIGYNGG